MLRIALATLYYISVAIIRMRFNHHYDSQKKKKGPVKHKMQGSNLHMLEKLTV